MRIVLGGSLETAFIRTVQQANDASRLATTHGYYMGLYRRVPKACFDRAATFVALAQQTQLPSVDWSIAEKAGEGTEPSREALGLVINDHAKYGGREWDDDARAFANLVLATPDVLSPEQHARITGFSMGDIQPEARAEVKQRARELRKSLGEHYLCRLFLHLRAAPEADALLVLGEDDMRLVGEIADWLEAERVPTPFAFPALSGRLIDADSFAAGLLNFAPPDAMALEAVRADRQVAAYAARIAPLLARTDEEAQRGLIAAMAETYERAEAGRRAAKVFETTSLWLKPLHYVPVVGDVLGIAEDVKDLLALWAKRETEAREWHLVGARMQDIALKDYLARKGNLVR